jgi:predicted RNA binding protein YcfA (HicA-like mRNA interferase family)
MVSFLQREGFQLLRVRGSHHFFEKGELRTSVPVHGNQPLRRARRAVVVPSYRHS